MDSSGNPKQINGELLNDLMTQGTLQENSILATHVFVEKEPVMANFDHLFNGIPHHLGNTLEKIWGLT